MKDETLSRCDFLTLGGMDIGYLAIMCEIWNHPEWGRKEILNRLDELRAEVSHAQEQRIQMMKPNA